jgi:hypothetical protein
MLLLLLGAVTAIAGVILVLSGVPVRDGTFDTEVVTPGTIAIVGGLLLVGLGLAVRQLQRIERVLAVRPMLRPARTEEVAAAVADALDVSARPPIPPKPLVEQPLVPAVAATIAATPTEDQAVERLRIKFPTLTRPENAPTVEAPDVPVIPRVPLRVEENVAEMKTAAAASRVNGASGPARIVPRLEVTARPAKASVFNTFWPAAPRRDGQAAPAQAVAAPVPPPPLEVVGPVHVEPPRPAAQEASHLAPVSVLKSGVVEGMAYTLYSDGSIEAQLPQGTLRFGSIAALRHHIESNP